MATTHDDPAKRAFTLLAELLDLDPTSRAKILTPLAATDPDLHARVISLLAADAAVGNEQFLEAGIAEVLALPADGPLIDERWRGRGVGPWRLTAPLGAGGMGQVWLAQRSDSLYQGQAAIKLLGRSATQSAVRARFVREGQVLGRLSHPNIARLLDAGVTDDGERYLVLEYVDGQRIDRYCDRQRLSVAQRIELFRSVCAAVAHAHENFVVHRDLKPSNVLVTERGEVKLLDFGIAKLLEAESSIAASTDAAEGGFTEVAGVALTPEYAAPEQVLGQAITTRTDVYALGVMLFVLLTGDHPCIEPGATRERRLRAIVDTEARRSSEQVRASGGRAERLAAERGTDAEKLSGELRGDLDNILQHALRKAPDERYASAQALANDLVRYLRHEPIEARADSVGYRARKFLRRHRAATGAVVITLVGLLAGLGIAVWQARVAREQAALAQSEVAKATAVKNFLFDLFRAGDVNAPGGSARADTTVAQLLDIGQARMVDSALASQPEVRAELLDQLAMLYLQTEAPEKSEQLYRNLHELRALSYGARDPRTIDAWISVGTALRNQGRYEEALLLYREALAGLDAAGGVEPATRGRALLEIAYSMFRITPDDPAAIRYAEQALELLRPLPADERLHEAYYSLGRAYETAGRLAEAERTFAEGIAVASKVLGPDTTAVAGGTQMRARVLGLMGRFTEAEASMSGAVEMFRTRVGDQHRYFIDASIEHGDLLERFGQWQRAEPIVRDGAEFLRRTRGPEHSLSIRSRLLLARLHQNAGEFAQAERAYLDVLATASGVPRPSRLFSAHLGLASLALQRGDGSAAAASRNNARNLLPEVRTQLGDLPDELRRFETRLAVADAEAAADARDQASFRVALDTAARLGETDRNKTAGDRQLAWRLRILEARWLEMQDAPAALTMIDRLLREIAQHPERDAYSHLRADALALQAAWLTTAGNLGPGCTSLRSAARLQATLRRETAPQRLAIERQVRSCPQPPAG